MHQLVILEMHAVLLDLFTSITIDLFLGFLFFFLHLLFQNETLEGTLPFYPYFLWYNSAKIMFAKIIRKESRLLHSHWKSFIASNTELQIPLFIWHPYSFSSQSLLFAGRCRVWGSFTAIWNGQGWRWVPWLCVPCQWGPHTTHPGWMLSRYGMRRAAVNSVMLYAFLK